MSWLTNVVRPKLQEWVGGGREVPDHLWQQCPACQQMIFHRELEKNLRVCQHCDHHLRLGVKERLAMLFDDASYDVVEPPKTALDPLKFRDLRRYADRLKEAQAKTGRADALAVAQGRIGGHSAVIAALDFAFMGGSMGIAVGEAFVAAARRAAESRAALIAVPASGGARMQEGILSLMQMARTTVAISEVRAAGLPYVVVLTDPTTGGVSASFAALGDVTLAEPGAVIGFAGARVIRETIRQTLPDVAIEEIPAVDQPAVVVPAEAIERVARQLREHADLQFQVLAELTAAPLPSRIESFSPRLDIAAMRHARGEVRLFSN